MGMTPIVGGGPAHPQMSAVGQQGISKRDLFAAHFLSGYVASTPHNADIADPATVARIAYDYAQAMIGEASIRNMEDRRRQQALAPEGDNGDQ